MNPRNPLQANTQRATRTRFPPASIPKNPASQLGFLLPPQIEFGFNRNCSEAVCSRGFPKRCEPTFPMSPPAFPFGFSLEFPAPEGKNSLRAHPCGKQRERECSQRHPAPGQPRMDQQSQSGPSPTLIPGVRNVPEQGKNPNFRRMSFYFSRYFHTDTWELGSSHSTIGNHNSPRKPQLIRW